MAMPLWIMCAPVSEPLPALLEDILADMIVAYGLRPYSAAPIDIAGKQISILDEEEVITRSLEELISVSHGRFGLDADFFSTLIGRHIRFLFFGNSQPYSLCLAIDSEVLALDHPMWGRSGWIVNFISKLTNRLGIDCCACAPDRWSGVFDSLDAHQFVAALRTGELLQTGPPAVFAARSELLRDGDLHAFSRNSAGYGIQQDRDVTIAWRMG